MIQYSLTNPYPFFWMGRERLETNIFCFTTTHMLPPNKMVSGDFSVWELGWSQAEHSNMTCREPVMQA